MVETVHDRLCTLLAYRGQKLTFTLDAGDHAHAKLAQGSQLNIQLNVAKRVGFVQKEPIPIIEHRLSLGSNLAEGDRKQQTVQRRKHRLGIVRAEQKEPGIVWRVDPFPDGPRSGMHGRDPLYIDRDGADHTLALPLAVAADGRACDRFLDQMIHLIGRKLQHRRGDIAGIRGATPGHTLQHCAEKCPGRIFEKGTWPRDHAAFGRQKCSRKGVGIIGIDQLVKDGPWH